MKGHTFATSGLMVASSLVAMSAAAPMPAMRRDASSSSTCSPYGPSGPLQFGNYANTDPTKVGGTGTAEGTLIVFPEGDTASTFDVQFYQLNQNFLGYTQGSSRNAGGSMGAPLEYFGQLRRTDTEQCLTGTSTDLSDGKRTSFRFASCSETDDDTTLSQLFVYQVSATGNVDVEYVAKKNTTQSPYNGENYDWITVPETDRTYLQAGVGGASDAENFVQIGKKASS